MSKVLLILVLLLSSLNAKELISPIPTYIEFNMKRALLGEKLFNDARLSKDNTISCATCHQLELGGDDGLQYSFGIDAQRGNMNSPTVFNAVYNFSQFWDGRAKDLQAQAAAPIENPVEMGFNFPELIVKLKKTEYKKLFDKLYAEGITKNSITHAIAEYEKTLITPNAPFDRYLRGEENAISKSVKEGYEIFKTKGCIACHQGINIGGNMYSTFGIVLNADSKELGRYNITKRESDRYAFKVPSLRNIAKTSPYFHDGRTDSLSEAVETMAMVQLGRDISQEEIEKIVLFLNALSAPVKKLKAH